MAIENLTLDLLISSGELAVVRKFMKSMCLTNDQRREKIVETYIYGEINLMENQLVGGGIQIESLDQFLRQEPLKAYFSQTNNQRLISDLLDILIEGTEVETEVELKTDERLLAFDILGIDHVLEAVKKMSQFPLIKEKIRTLISGGYSLVFCPADNDERRLRHYYAIIDNFREYIDPMEIAKEAIKEFDDIMDNFSRTEKNFIYTAIDLLIELTSRQAVSKLMYEYYGREEYEKLIKDKKIDPYTPDFSAGEISHLKYKEALNVFERKYIITDNDLDNLAQAIGEGWQKALASRMGDWFINGEITRLLKVINYRDGQLFNQDVAKSAISYAIRDLIFKEDNRKLKNVFKLPQYLINNEDPSIKEVVMAYYFSKNYH